MVGGYGNILALCCASSTFLTSSCHIALQFEAISWEIGNITKYKSSKCDGNYCKIESVKGKRSPIPGKLSKYEKLRLFSDQENKNMSEKLKEIIRKHYELMDLTETLTDIYTPIGMILFVAAAIVIGISAILSLKVHHYTYM